MPEPSVVIILVNWNGLRDTLACLSSLQHLQYANARIVVVDNGSQDNSAAIIRQKFPLIDVIESNENLGFVGGNHLGLIYAQEEKADYALLLNNDTEVAPNFLDLLVASAEAGGADCEAARIGIVGPLTFYFHQPEVIWSAGGSIDWRRGETHMIGIGEKDQGQLGSSPRKVDFVTGCALLIKMSVVAQIGELDERFFAYYEDVEWCMRARRAGYEILCIPQAKVWHKISPEAREVSPLVHYYMTRNRLLFLQCSRASWQAWLHTAVEYGRTLISWTIKPKWRHKAVQRRMMARAITDFLQKRYGKVQQIA